MSIEREPSATSSGLLLDTSVVVPVLRGDVSLLQRIAGYLHVYLCAPVLAELYIGLERRGHPIAQAQRLNALLAQTPVLPCDEEAAPLYAEIESHLRRLGTPIPVNDLWIAAVARQHRLLLATRDAHYERIPELQVEVW